MSMADLTLRSPCSTDATVTRVTACATEWLGQLSVRQALTAGTTPTATEDLLTTVKNVIRRSKLSEYLPHRHLYSRRELTAQRCHMHTL